MYFSYTSRKNNNVKVAHSTPLDAGQPENGFQQARFELLREEHVRCTCTMPAASCASGPCSISLYMQALIHQEAQWWTPIAPAMTSKALWEAMPADPTGPSAGP